MQLRSTATLTENLIKLTVKLICNGGVVEVGCSVAKSNSCVGVFFNAILYIEYAGSPAINFIFAHIFQR